MQQRLYSAIKAGNLLQELTKLGWKTHCGACLIPSHCSWLAVRVLMGSPSPVQPTDLNDGGDVEAKTIKVSTQNQLMQLRKCCNHPYLFGEPPVSSKANHTDEFIVRTAPCLPLSLCTLPLTPRVSAVHPWHR